MRQKKLNVKTNGTLMVPLKLFVHGTEMTLTSYALMGLSSRVVVIAESEGRLGCSVARPILGRRTTLILSIPSLLSNALEGKET